MNIHNLIGRDLCGWEVRVGFYVKTSHTYKKGFYTAVVDEGKKQDEKIVICFSMKDIQEVLKKMPIRPHQFDSMCVLFNEEKELVVQLTDNLSPDNFFPAYGKILEDSLEKEGFFAWQTGLIAVPEDF